MNAERLLQTCVTLMAALATLMLGTSQESSSLPVIAVIVAAASLIFTDYLGWFYLHRYLAGAAGVVFVTMTLMQAHSAGLETQFISVANLLIYLQMILLFQQKTLRVYWQLIVLSLLQVVTAAALNLFFLFGPLLVIYTGIALSALLLFFIHRETAAYSTNEDTSESADTDEPALIEVERAGTRMRIFGVKEVNPRRLLVQRSFLRHFGLMSVSTVIVSAVVFLLMPRFGDGVWRVNSGISQTGYSGEVDLDDSSAILESPAVVMRVNFYDDSDGTARLYEVSNVPYFRGGILNIYEPGAGRWSRDREPKQGVRGVLEANSVYSVVRQEITMERQRGGVVFSVAPVRRSRDGTDSIGVNPWTHEIVYRPEDDEDPAQYAIGTAAFRNGLQSEYVPVYRRASRAESSQYAVSRLPQLTALADEVIAQAQLERGDVVEKARALEAHFANSGLYRYSLDPSPNRNYNEDPVEDFVTNHRTGHCQYFASALTLMLRSQGIPARVVVGYHGGVFNVVGNYYQIREMDAHAWVEALVPADQIPADEVLPMEGFELDERGERPAAWLRLDPTPGGLALYDASSISPWRTKLDDAIDYVQLLWSEYVLGLNQKRQKKAIYDPIRRAFSGFFNYVFNAERWTARLQSLRDRFQGDLFTRRNVRDVIVAVAALTAGFYLLRLLVRGAALVSARWWKRQHARQPPRVEFYRRLEKLLARHGIKRIPQQTPREHAQRAEQAFLDRLEPSTLAKVPVEIVDAFYGVRFGKRRLDSGELQRLDSSIHQLQQALARSPRPSL